MKQRELAKEGWAKALEGYWRVKSQKDRYKHEWPGTESLKREFRVRKLVDTGWEWEHDRQVWSVTSWCPRLDSEADVCWIGSGEESLRKVKFSGFVPPDPQPQPQLMEPRMSNCHQAVTGCPVVLHCSSHWYFLFLMRLTALLTLFLISSFNERPRESQ